jgi:hypothetical protein
VELEKLHECVARVEDECAVEAVQLSRSVMEISNALVDVGVLPIRDTWHNRSLPRMLSVFFAPAKYRVVKIVCSCSEVVL